jgi:hypothetical protein
LLTSAVLAPAWRALLDRLIADYRSALAADLVAIALFGSVARGQAGPDSDVDLYVVTRAPISVLCDRRLDRVRRVREGAEAEALQQQGYRPRPMPIYHSIEQLIAHPWILLDIAHHGIVLYDPESVLARELDAIRRRLRELGSRRVELPDGTWYWHLKPDWRPGDIVAL